MPTQSYRDKIKAENEAVDESTSQYDDLVAILILIATSNRAKNEKLRLIAKYQKKIAAYNASFSKRQVESVYKQFSLEALNEIKEFENLKKVKVTKLSTAQKAEMSILVQEMESRLNKRLDALIEDANRLTLKEELIKVREKKMGFVDGQDKIQITTTKAKPDLVFVNAQGKVVKMDKVMKVTVGDQIWSTIFDSKRSTYLKLGYRYVRHISIIDEKTTEICRSLNGKIRDLAKDKIPPMHPNCRSDIELLKKDFKP